MKKRFVIAFGLSSLLTASTALAQEASVTDEKPAGSFATLDRGDASSKVGVAAAMTFIDSDQSNTALRLDLHGQYVMPNGIGIYGSLPLSHLSTESTTPGMDDFSEMALGNLEIGGLYNHKLSNKLTLTARAGLSLPTADDEFDGAITNLANMLPRMTDMISMAGDTTTLRASASINGKEGQFFYRADAGFDIPVDTPMGEDIDPLVRFNIGAGVNAGPMAFTGEIVTVGTTGDVGEDEDRFLHTAALSATLTSNKQIQPTLSLVLPLRGDVTELFDASVMLGVQGRLP